MCIRNRDSNTSIIPKIILILGTLSILGIIVLFFRPRPVAKKFQKPPISSEKLFSQVILASSDEVLRLWEDGDRFISKEGLQCPGEITFQTTVGRSFYQCQPHFWQCYWEKGVIADPSIKLDMFGQTYHVRARASFSSIPAYSEANRFYELFHTTTVSPLRYGMLIELEVAELPGYSQRMILTDTCRDSFLPERIYAYGTANKKSRDEGFIWDNFDRKIFLDRFYVTNQ